MSLTGGRQVLRGTGSVATGTLVAQLVTGAAFVLVARRTSPSAFGLFAALYATSVMLGNLLDFGSSQWITRHLARGEGKETFKTWLFTRTFKQAPFCVLGVPVAFYVGSDLGVLAVIGLALQPLTVSIANGAAAAVRSLRTPGRAAWSTAVGNGVTLLAAATSPEALAIPATALAASISWLVSASINMSSLRSEHLGPWHFDASHRPWMHSRSFGVASIAFMAQSLSVPLIGIGGGAAEAGLTAAVHRWIQPLILVPSAFSQYIFPELSAADSNSEAVQRIRPARISVCIVAVGALLVIALAPIAVPSILGSEYRQSIGVLQLYAAATVLVAINQPMSTLMQARGFDGFVARTASVGAFIELISVFIFARDIGALAGPISMVLTNVAVLLALGRSLRRQRSMSDG